MFNKKQNVHKFNENNLYYGNVKTYTDVVGARNLDGIVEIDSKGYEEYATLLYIEGEIAFDVYNADRTINLMSAATVGVPSFSENCTIYIVDGESLKPYDDVVNDYQEEQIEECLKRI